MTDTAMRDIQWIGQQVPKLEQAIAQAIRKRWSETGVGTDDHREAWNQVLHLKRMKDCYYDLPSIGPFYAAAYHAKRTQQAVSALYFQIEEAQRSHEPVEIIDIGAGTGANLWGVSLILLALNARGIRLPNRLRIVECDASPFMLRQGRLLWDELKAAFPVLPDLIDRMDPQYCSWDRVQLPDARRPWIVASYLLHASEVESDAGLTADGALAASLGKIADRQGASQILAWQSKSKRRAMQAAFAGLTSAGWEDRITKSLNAAFTGERGRVSSVISSPELVALGLEDWSRTAAYWYADFPPEVVRLSRQTLDLFQWCPLPNIEFDEQQQELLLGKPKHAMIQGAAGSGKTMLLAERLAQAIRDASSAKPRRVLVTTFNKQVIDSIGAMIGVPPTESQPLDRSSSESGRWEIVGQVYVHVLARNFDSLPWHFRAVSGGVTHLRGSIATRMQPYAEALSARLNRSISGAFIEDEFELIIYGRCAGSLADYRNPSVRRGRAHLGELVIHDREALFEKIGEHIGSLSDPTCSTRSFPHARAALLRQVTSNSAGRGFTDVFVDEAQDLTRSDWMILNALASPDAAWTVCWDRTQAIRTGKAFDSPRSAVPKLKDVAVVELRRAYRVPRQIAKFANVLASSMAAAGASSDREESCLTVEPQMHAIPGPRPLIVYGDDPSVMSSEIHASIATWSALLPYIKSNPTLVAEKSFGSACSSKLRHELESHGWEDVRTDSVMATKGIEFETVVWLADIPFPSNERWEETLFTILTRTRHLLVIAFTPKIEGRALQFLKSVLSGHRDLARWNTGAEKFLKTT